MFDDFKELLSIFNDQRVKYLIVGGYAVSFHAQPRATKDQAWQPRVETVIDPASGLTAFFISREDLIAAKLAAGRPQDIADVAALRKAAQSQAGTGINKKRPRN